MAAQNGKRKLELKREVGMLLAPELDQRFREPTTLPKPAMDPGVAGGAESDEEFFPVNAGKTMMDG